MTRVLIGCEFSGVVRRAFRERGHEAYSCDLMESEDASPYHIQGDVLDVIGDGWDLAVFHPPCTYLTNAGVRHLFDAVTSRRGNRAKVFGEARWEALREGAAFFNALAAAPIERIAIENPIPHKYARELIGPYSQLIQPWWFGHGETKGTCLWLKNLPPLMATCVSTGRYARVHLAPPSPDRWKERSRTYTGIAAAMAEQWGSMIQLRECAGMAGHTPGAGRVPASGGMRDGQNLALASRLRRQGAIRDVGRRRECGAEPALSAPRRGPHLPMPVLWLVAYRSLESEPHATGNGEVQGADRVAAAE